MYDPLLPHRHFYVAQCIIMHGHNLKFAKKDCVGLIYTPTIVSPAKKHPLPGKHPGEKKHPLPGKHPGDWFGYMYGWMESAHSRLNTQVIGLATCMAGWRVPTPG